MAAYKLNTKFYKAVFRKTCCSKALIESSEWLNVGARLKNAKVALHLQIWSTNTKPFSWESNANLKTLRIISLHVGVSYKLVLKYAKGLNWTFWSIEGCYKAQKCKIFLTNMKPFFWESATNPSYKFVLKSMKSVNQIF